MADETTQDAVKETTEEVETTTPEVESTPEPAKEKQGEKKSEEKKEEKQEAEVEVPEKFKKLVAQIEEMSVLELSELVKSLEKKFGVSAAAVAVAGPAAGGAAGAEEAKSTMNVELTDAGANKIAVIKAVKDALGLGLKEAKDLVDAAPSVLKENASKDDAEGLKKKIEEAGAKVTLK